MNHASVQDHLSGRVHDEHLSEHQFGSHAWVFSGTAYADQSLNFQGGCSIAGKLGTMTG